MRYSAAILGRSAITLCPYSDCVGILAHYAGLVSALEERISKSDMLSVAPATPMLTDLQFFAGNHV
jgi:hypothetical protein